MTSVRPALNRYTADVGVYLHTVTVTSAYKWQARAKAIAKFHEFMKSKDITIGQYTQELLDEYPHRIFSLLYDEGDQSRPRSVKDVQERY